MTTETSALPVRADDNLLLDPLWDDHVIHQRVVAFYHQRLKEHAPAQQFLKRRGLDDAQMIDHFQVGFADRALGRAMPRAGSALGKEIRSRLQSLGLYRESGHGHHNGCVVVPVCNDAGHLQELYGRKIAPGFHRQWNGCHLYLSETWRAAHPERGVLNASALSESEDLFLCDSVLNALTFWCAGHRNVTCSWGLGGFTDQHRRTLTRLGTKRVLIAYRRTDEGNQAAAELGAHLASLGIRCFRIEFPQGMDANRYALKAQHASEAINLLVRDARPMGACQAVEPGVEPFDGLTAHPASEPTRSEEVEEAADETADTAPEQASPAADKPDVADTTPTRAEPSPAPATPGDVQTEVKENEAVISLGDRRYRVRGLDRNVGLNQLKVNLLVSRAEAVHVDTFDLYSARHRELFVRQAAAELGLQEAVVRKDVAKVLLALEDVQERLLQKTLTTREKSPVMTEVETQAALELLRDPSLLDRILSDFEASGVVGEEANKLVGYLSIVSRKLDRPLAVVIQSSSAAGKSLLLEAVLAFVPPEDQVKYSAMTGQSLFYMGQRSLKHRILAIAEDEGAEQANYALKLLQSEGELRIASTGKDSTTGRLETQEYHVEGPVMIFLTTTAIDVDEELMNRCIVLTVNEDREQTRAIHHRQREDETLQGLLAARRRVEIIQRHHNAQRLLRPILVVNPYAHQLTFLDTQTRMRRDHLKYLTLIRSITLLHQYQRTVKTTEYQGKTIEYIEVTAEDIAMANRLADQVLGRSLDELPPQTRRLLLLLDEMVTRQCEELSTDRSDFRFTRRELREHTGWGNTQLKIHLQRLQELEYVLAHRGGRARQFAYELLYDGRGQEGQPVLSGLIDTSKLRNASPYSANQSGSEAQWSGGNGQWSGSGRPLVGAESGGGRAEKDDATQLVLEPSGSARDQPG
jgi:hypothetical protein